MGRNRPDSDRYVEDKLYDNIADPAQHHNLVRDPATADLRAELAARLLGEIERVEGCAPTIAYAMTM